ncbi:hypothetical protein NLJ89_g8643 [Agrocybe chaxingu]|uniref:Uncharacterized protein n=1 Tax=Agrocybe chaxingu TaxID=84603 RepID=A0A9W8JU98_9AGAR|nr:hypothetical protein NLJ89_g8643 [Agrocybe chaxingu]
MWSKTGLNTDIMASTEAIGTTRPVFLFVTPSPLFPAHWGLAIPDIDESTWVKVIHATGSVAEGFEHAFKRDYNTELSTTRYKKVFLGDVAQEHIVYKKDPSCPEEPRIDTAPVDRMEEIALAVPAPAASLNTVKDTSKPGTRVLVKNCQTWMREYVQALIAAGVSKQDALDILDKAPKN